MGSEFAQQSKVGGRSQVQASFADHTAGYVDVPGKQTQAQQAPTNDGTSIVRDVQARAGQTVTEGTWAYVVQASGEFKVTAAPSTNGKSIGVAIRIGTKPWLQLASELLLQSFEGVSIPARTPKPRETVALPDHLTARAVTDKDGAVPGEYQYLLKANELRVGDAAIVVYDATFVTPEHRFPGKQPKIDLAAGTEVTVQAIDNDLVQLEQGWVRAAKVKRVPRAPRPSKATAQMISLLAAARANHGKAHGNCFRYVKNYIAIAGGYGDIASIYDDPRFSGISVSAKDFAAWIERIGLAKLGLEKVGGLPHEQLPGTLLITAGNAKATARGLRLSEEHGDIAVIGAVTDGATPCYNDGVMPLSTDATKWDAGGIYEHIIVGMYRPVDRN